MVSGLVVVVLVLAVGIGALVVLRNGGQGREQAAPGRSTPAATPSARSTANGTAPSAGRIKAARPRDVRVKVVEHGRAVVLRWKLSRTARTMPVYVRRAPGKHLTRLKNGARTATVTHLKPKTRYCFQVITKVAAGNPPTLAKTRPKCVRGTAAP